jgi:WD40 repeat protein
VARRTELAPGHWALVQHLADRRLVVTGRDEAGDETVEVVHEALIRGWERLRSWMMADRAFRSWQEGLRVAQRGWESSGRDEGSLLRAAPLALALEWANEHQTQLSANEAEFIESSRQASEKRAVEEAARRQRELETAQKLAETEHARAEEQEMAASGLRRRAYFLGGVVVVALLLAIAAFFFARQSSKNADLAATREAEALAEADNRATAEAIAVQREAEAVDEADQRATAQAQAEIESQRADGERDAAVSAQATAVAEGLRADEQRDVALVAGVEADEARVAAEEQAQIAFSREVAAEAVNNLEQDPERSVLLALQALNIAHTQQAEEALHQGIPKLRLLNTFVGHEHLLSRLDYSPDGSRIVSSSFDKTARVWDVATGEEVLRLSVPESKLYRVRYSPDGSFIVTAGEDATARVWDAVTGELLNAYAGHSEIPNREDPDIPNAVIGVAINQDNQTVATSDYAGQVKLWDATTGAELKTFDLSENAVIHHWLRFTNDGSWLVIKGSGNEIENNYVRIIDVESGSEVMKIDDGWMESIAISWDGSRLLVGEDFERAMRLYDLDTMEEVARYATQDIGGPRFSPDGSLFSTRSEDGKTIHIWETETGSQIINLTGPQRQINDIHFSPDGSRLATASGDGTVRIWDLGPDYEILTVHPFPDDVIMRVSQIAINRDGTMLAAGGVFGQLSLWDPRTGDRLLTLEGHDDWIGGLGFSPDGDRLASGSDDRTVKVWDTTSGELLLTLTGHEDWINNITYSPDGATIASVGSDKQSFVWDAASGEVIHQLPLSDESWSIAYSPDSSLLATGERDGSNMVTIWDMATGEAVREIDYQDGVADLNFTSDSSTLITGGYDGYLKTWDIETGEVVQEIKAATSVIQDSSISPDWKTIATATGSNAIRLWDLESGQGVLTIEVPEIDVIRVAFTPDGKQLAVAGSPDGYVRFYALSLEELVDVAESRLTRTLTEEECQEYLRMDACPVD